MVPPYWQDVARIVALVEGALHNESARADPSVTLLAGLVLLVGSFPGHSVPVLETVTTSVTTNPEQRLLTPDEAAVLAGPSFTAKRLYRLRGGMPEQAWVRKGGRLYFREGPYRRWLATR